MAFFTAARTVSFALMLFVSGTVPAQEAPKRKPGLWQQTVTSTGMPMPAQTMSVCADEKTDNLLAQQAGSEQRCSPASVQRQGGAYVVETVCKDGKTTVRTQGRFSGDFNSRYAGDLRTSFDPPMHGMKEMAQKIEARWLGPCKPGQKPGDVVMEGKGAMNMHELMKMDPHKMQEMMKR